MLWVIPTRYDLTRPVIYECVESIQRHHPDAHIVVIDSASEDRSYMQWCADRGCAVADIANRGYAHGAFGWAVRNYPDEQFYALIFDSLIVNANLDYLQDAPFTAIRHWSHLEHDWGWDGSGVHLSIWGNQQLHQIGLSFPSEYHGILGPAFFAQRDVVDRLGAIGYWDIPVTDAFQHCAMERVAGIVLESMDLDVTQSLQGVHYGHHSHYDESAVRKIDMARA